MKSGKGVTADEKDQTNHKTFRQRESAHTYPHVHPKNARPKNGVYAGYTAIVQSLARAFSWADILESGEIKSISELARDLDVDSSYVARTLKLTTLAPDIIEAIINGEEPSGLSLSKLVKTFPLDWSEQRTFFGFS